MITKARLKHLYDRTNNQEEYLLLPREQLALLDLALKGLAAKKLEKACQFYADADNWSIDQARTDEANYNQISAAHGVYTSIWNDTDSSGVSLGHITNSIGGSKAREAISSYRKEIGVENE